MPYLPNALQVLVATSIIVLGAAAPALGQAGTPDPTFGEDGIVTRGVGVAEVHVARGIAVAPDDRVLLAGLARDLGPSPTWFGLARLLPDGVLDSTFGNDGFAEAAFERSAAAHAVVLQPDGRAVAAGWTEEPDGDQLAFAVARFDVNGAPDPTFGEEGLVVTPFDGGWDAEGNAVAIQPDGRIVVAGSVVLDTEGAFAVVRYLPDGSLDPDFGDGGRVTTSLSAYPDRARAVAIDGEGRIVTAGVGTGVQDIAVVRLLSDGTPDPNFGTDGRVLLDLGSHDEGYALALQPDGHIVLAGYSIPTSSRRDFALVRLAEDGTLDGTFGEGGVVRTEFTGSSYAHAVVALPAGKLLAAGQEIGQGEDAVLARYLSDGTLDPSFGDGGRRRDVGLTDAWAMALATDGRAVVAGVAPLPGGSGFAAVRIEADGDPDAAFGVDGLARARGLGDDIAGATAVAALPDGRVAVAGCATTSTTEGFVVARLDAEGAFDPSFGMNGEVLTEFEVAACAVAVGLHPNGSVTAVARSAGLAAARYLPDGSLDPTFDEDGRVTAFPGFVPKAGMVFHDGGILATGCVGGAMKVARLLPDGSPDPDFGDGGLSSGSLSGCANALAVRPDGRIVAVGSVVIRAQTDESIGIVAQFLPDGTLDPAFGEGGGVSVQLPNTLIHHLTSVGLLTDGRVVVGATVGVIDVEFALLAFHPDGERDFSFGGSGGVRPIGDPSSASALTVLPNDRVLMAIWAPAPVFGRFNPDGSLDEAFGDGGLVEITPDAGLVVTELALLPDGRFYGAGRVGGYSGLRGEVAVARFLGDIDVADEPGASASKPSFEVYPNPASERAMVSLMLEEAAKVHVAVYDVLGRRVTVLHDGPFAAGEHRLTLDGSGLPAGIYVVQARSETFTLTRRITLVW